MNGLTYPHMVELERLVRLLFSRRDAYFKFTIVRNPFTRIASAYIDKISESSPSQLQTAVERLRYVYFKEYGRLLETFSFEDFIDAIARERQVDMNRHWQHQHVLCCRDFVELNWTIKIEEMPQKLDLLLKKLGAKGAAVETLNRNRSDIELQDLYTPKLLGKVANLYARDFRLLRYDPEHVPPDHVQMASIDPAFGN